MSSWCVKPRLSTNLKKKHQLMTTCDISLSNLSNTKYLDMTRCYVATEKHVRGAQSSAPLSLLTQLTNQVNMNNGDIYLECPTVSSSSFRLKFRKCFYVRFILVYLSENCCTQFTRSCCLIKGLFLEVFGRKDQSWQVCFHTCEPLRAGGGIACVSSLQSSGCLGGNVFY